MCNGPRFNTKMNLLVTRMRENFFFTPLIYILFNKIYKETGLHMNILVKLTEKKDIK
jgi:hypothetical protein